MPPHIVISLNSIILDLWPNFHLFVFKSSWTFLKKQTKSSYSVQDWARSQKFRKFKVKHRLWDGRASSQQQLHFSAVFKEVKRRVATLQNLVFVSVLQGNEYQAGERLHFALTDEWLYYYYLFLHFQHWAPLRQQMEVKLHVWGCVSCELSSQWSLILCSQTKVPADLSCWPNKPPVTVSSL